MPLTDAAISELIAEYVKIRDAHDTTQDRYRELRNRKDAMSTFLRTFGLFEKVPPRNPGVID